MSPARPQDLALTAHLLGPTNICLTFSPKLFFPAFLLTQAKRPQTTPTSDGGSPDETPPLHHTLPPSPHPLTLDHPDRPDPLSPT